MGKSKLWDVVVKWTNQREEILGGHFTATPIAKLDVITFSSRSMPTIKSRWRGMDSGRSL